MNLVLGLVCTVIFFAGFLFFNANASESTMYEYLQWAFILLTFVPLMFIFVDYKAGKIPKLTPVERRESRLAARNERRDRRDKRRKDRFERLVRRY